MPKFKICLYADQRAVVTLRYDGEVEAATEEEAIELAKILFAEDPEEFTYIEEIDMTHFDDEMDVAEVYASPA